MTEDNDFQLIINLYFTKKPKNDTVRKALLEKLKEWFEKEDLPLKMIKSQKKLISLASDKYFIGFSCYRNIKGIFALSGTSEEEATEFNDIMNRIAVYLNTLLGDFAQNIRVQTDLEDSPYNKIKVDITKFMNKAYINKVGKGLYSTPKPIIAGFEFRFDGHRDWVLFLAKGVIAYRSTSVLKVNIPLDLIQSENKHMGKLVEIVNKLKKAEDSHE